MSQADRFEVLVLGSGEAGKYTAWTTAKQGMTTAVVERGLIGGSCPNIACLPSKNIIHSAKVADLLRHGRDFGVGDGAAAVEMASVRGRKRKMVEGLVNMHLGKYRASGAELILGEGRFVAPKTMEVRMAGGKTRTLRGDRVILSVGTRAAIPDVPGLKAAKPLTHIEALELDRVPEHVIVLGGGYVGLELGQALARFGSRVTIVARGPRVLSREDSDVADAVLGFLREDGLEVQLNAELTGVEGSSGNSVRVQLRTPQGARTLEGSDILVATGRVPNTGGIGLEKIGVELDARGYIRVNERLETTAPDIWAVGDCAGSPHFTHVAFDDFRVVRDNFHGGSRTTRDRLVPYCLFIDPELAHVGLNELEAAKTGRQYRLAKIPVGDVLRTRTLSETRGFLKALISADSDQILGFTALGPQAGELMAVVQTAMVGNMPYTALRDAIFTHPTMAEGLIVLFSAVPARSQAGAPR
jgi:pyruvate/2-oxoglutarate dehydrogenase complex dihydrolipoamide dehydrogenase (E3) component